MNNINFSTVVKALYKIVRENYGPEKEEEPTSKHFTIAEYLLQQLEQAEMEWTFIDENENIFGNYCF